MLKVMLEAVSEMLELNGLPPLELKVKVGCAKTILDKVIEGLGDSPKEAVPFAVDAVVPIAEPKPKPKPEPLKGPVDGKYKIVKDDNNKLVRIEGLPLDAKIELDGKVMTHLQARGKQFISGRIL